MHKQDGFMYSAKELYQRRQDEVCAKISAALKGKPSHNPSGKSKGAPQPRIPAKRMKAALRRVLRRTCARCVYRLEMIAIQQRADRTVS
jgi:hypothetical protein